MTSKKSNIPLSRQIEPGQLYGYLKIMGAPKKHYVEVECTFMGCGVRYEVYIYNLKKPRGSGSATRCKACANRVVPKGLTRVYRRFAAAKQRCENPNNVAYADYGARGITFEFARTVDAVQWALAEFGKQALENPKLSIDRRDNNGPYSEDNLRLATRSQQARNMQHKRAIRLENGQTVDLVRFYEHMKTKGVCYAYSTFSRYVRAGCTTEAMMVDQWNKPSCKPKGVPNKNKRKSTTS